MTLLFCLRIFNKPLPYCQETPLMFTVEHVSFFKKIQTSQNYFQMKITEIHSSQIAAARFTGVFGAFYNH